MTMMGTSSWVFHTCFFFSSRRRHTRLQGDWSSDVCSSDLGIETVLGSLGPPAFLGVPHHGRQHAKVAPFHADVWRAFHPEAGALRGRQLSPSNCFRALRGLATRSARVHPKYRRGLLIGIGIERAQSQPAQVVQPGGGLEFNADLGQPRKLYTRSYGVLHAQYVVTANPVCVLHQE